MPVHARVKPITAKIPNRNVANRGYAVALLRKSSRLRTNAMGWLGSTALTAWRAPLESASGSAVTVRIANIIPGREKGRTGRRTAGYGWGQGAGVRNRD